MDTIAIIQARMSSTRLPGKVLLGLGGKPMLQNIIERAGRAGAVDLLVTATSTEPDDDAVAALCESIGSDVFRGELSNVLSRFYHCAKRYGLKTVVRLTADNALIDPGIIDEAILRYHAESVDYLHYREGLPLGMCVEVFSFAALEQAFREATNPECLEHVTPYLYRNPNLFQSVFCPIEPGDTDRSSLRFTMDSPADYAFISRIYDDFGRNDFSYAEILDALEAHPEWLSLNRSVRQKVVSYSGE